VRICRVTVDGRPAWGRVDGDAIHLLRDCPLRSRPVTVATVPASGVTFLPPVVPPVFYAVGFNYAGHAPVPPERPEVGYRANNALIGHGAAIVKPSDVEGRFEAEGELVAVIGRTLRRARRDEAREGVFGWTIGNDVSAREWQHRDRTFWRSKNSDTFKPMGPWIETDVDALAQTTTVRVDGAVRASFPTGAMLFDPFDFIVETTKYITMHPGDVLWLGADGTCQLEPGNVVDIEITGIGTLSNPVREGD
jgi:2-keto-4-pentenoate hydratase/2-oxohepta-3-ene-1,7-dioic acid hydratase in catechol pathway